MIVQERYSPMIVAVNTAVQIKGEKIGGFLCQTTGTFTLVSFKHDAVPQRTLLTAFPVTAGIYYPLPFFIGTNGGTFTTAGGASGLLGV
jgi:hypothetical protein